MAFALETDTRRGGSLLSCELLKAAGRLTRPLDRASVDTSHTSHAAADPRQASHGFEGFARSPMLLCVVSCKL